MSACCSVFHEYFQTRLERVLLILEFHSPAGRGIGHQIMVEEGYAFPGTMTVSLSYFC